jgi:hypothetical protein
LQKWAEDPSGIFAVVLTPTRYAFLMTYSHTQCTNNFIVNWHCKYTSSSRPYLRHSR